MFSHKTSAYGFSVCVCVWPLSERNTQLYNVTQYLTATHLFIERVQEDGRLNRLSQTHLVGQDGVGALSPGEPEPVETLQLVGVQRPPRAVQVLGLTVELYSRLGTEEKETGTDCERRRKLGVTCEVCTAY